jgi:Pyruvate/2-oxoacid:ferredoxin oxidoreductase delta subunit
MTPSEAFVIAFDVWEEARPYLHLMVDEQEMRLVVALAGQTATVAELAKRLGITLGEASELVRRAYRRHVVDKAEGEEMVYTAASFYDFLDYFAKHENWDDLPAKVRRRIDRRFLDEFIARHRENVARKVQGLEAEGSVPNDDVLLLHQVLEMADAAEQIVVEPCDCRRLGQNCERPVETCIWFNEAAQSALDRGHGSPLTHQEAKDLLRWTDQKGLMHTGDSQWRTRGLHYLCNCCACDCYPFRAAQELGSKGVWPKSLYIAVYEEERCNLCGACVRRCHFEAFYHDGSTTKVDGKAKKRVRYDAERCWGCGLCANTCPSEAIQMEPLA